MEECKKAEVETKVEAVEADDETYEKAEAQEVGGGGDQPVVGGEVEEGEELGQLEEQEGEEEGQGEEGGRGGVQKPAISCHAQKAADSG